MTVSQLGKSARAASAGIARAASGEKNALLLRLAELLRRYEDDILAANREDMKNAEAGGMREALLDRLLLNPARLSAMADSLAEMAALPDPVGVVTGGSVRPNGLRIVKRKVPLGVVAMIYESRPNVTVDAAALCLKAGNAVILRGGKEAICSNKALVSVIKDALEQLGFSRDAVGLVTDTSRASAAELMELTDYVDLLIPRGGKGLIEAVVKGAKVPVIETGAGNCHIYVDASADLDMALAITDNAKTSRPSVCNAAETLLVHADIAGCFLPRIFDLIGDRVEFRGDARAKAILPGIGDAGPDDWYLDYTDYILAVGVVDGVEAAVAHINTFGTGHSDAIVTESVRAADFFIENVDSAAVYLNASTRFTDGGEFGLSAEIGISTSKLHARGPMGLEALTTDKYEIRGSGQVR